MITRALIGCTTLQRRGTFFWAIFSIQLLALFWEMRKNDHQRAGAVLRNEYKWSLENRRCFEKWEKMITKEQALFWEITRNDHQRSYFAFCFVSCGYRDDGSRSWNQDEVYLLVFSSTVFFDYDNDDRDSNDNDIQPLFHIFSLFLLDLPD